jgi:hypothetical protein
VVWAGGDIPDYRDLLGRSLIKAFVIAAFIVYSRLLRFVSLIKAFVIAAFVV